jgi:ubiquinone/menaquinone biosynthesis C-methylase UbiE
MYPQSDQILKKWRESAPYWETHRHTIRQMLAPLTAGIIAEAAIGEGHSVLDVAGGTGEPALTIADVVGARGSVTCTDAVLQMVAAARGESLRCRLTNLGFCQCAADSLPFPAAVFDVTVSRLGVMLFADPFGALVEMLRVTKPGGRVTAAVWQAAALNPFFSVVSSVVSRYVDSAPEDPLAPGAFRFAREGELAELMTRAGAVEVRQSDWRFRIEATITPEEFWTVRSQMSETLRDKLATLSAEQVAQVASEAQGAARGYYENGKISFPAQAWIVTGVR